MSEPEAQEIKIPQPTLIRRLEGCTARVNQLALSPNERYLIGAGEETVLYMWDMTTGALVRTIDLKQEKSRSSFGSSNVCWSNESDAVLVASPDGNVCIWKEFCWFWQSKGEGMWDAGIVRRAPEVPNTYHTGTQKERFEAVAISKNGLFAAARNGCTSIFRTQADAKPKFLFEHKHGSGSPSLVFSPNGSKLAVNTQEELQIFLVKDIGLTPAGPAFRLGRGKIIKVAWLTEDILLSGSASGAIGIHSNTANTVNQLSGTDVLLNTFCVVDEQTLIVSLKNNRQEFVYIVSLPDLTVLNMMRGFEDVRSILLRENGRYLILSDSHAHDGTGWMRYAPGIYDFGAPNLGRKPENLIPEITI